MNKISSMMKIRSSLHSICWTSNTLVVNIPEALIVVHPPNADADAAGPVYAVYKNEVSAHIIFHDKQHS